MEGFEASSVPVDKKGATGSEKVVFPAHDLDSGPRIAPAFHPLLDRRLHLLQGVASLSDFPPERRAEWNAPHGPAEQWELGVTTRRIPGPHGDVLVRVYSPLGRGGASKGLPCLVWMHGGGFVAGDLDMPEAHEVAKGVAGRASAVVVSVDYRLCGPAEGFLEVAGEREGSVSYPIPLDDAVAAFQWVAQNAADLDVDPQRIAVGGASAGGNLAAGVVLRLKNSDVRPSQALLLYPLVHPELPAPTIEMIPALTALPAALRLSSEVVVSLSENYLGAPTSKAVPEAFAALSEDLSVFPPTLIEHCEFDDLRRSSQHFALALRAAGVDVESVLVEGVPHGHLNRIGFPPAHASLDRMARRLRDM